LSLGSILPEAIEPVGARAAADDAGSWFPPQRVARTVREGPCCLSSGPQGAIDALHREALHRLVRLFKEGCSSRSRPIPQSAPCWKCMTSCRYTRIQQESVELPDRRGKGGRPTGALGSVVLETSGNSHARATTIVQLDQARKRHDRRIDEAEPKRLGTNRTSSTVARQEEALTAPVGASPTTPASPPAPGGRRRRHRPRSGRSPSAPRASWARRRAHTWLRSPAAAPGGRRRW